MNDDTSRLPGRRQGTDRSPLQQPWATRVQRQSAAAPPRGPLTPRPENDAAPAVTGPASRRADAGGRPPEDRPAGPVRRSPEPPRVDPRVRPQRQAPGADPVEPQTRPIGTNRSPAPPRAPEVRQSPPGRAAPTRIEPRTASPARARPQERAPERTPERTPEPKTELVRTVERDEETTAVPQVSPAAPARAARKAPARKERTLGSALLATAASTIAPGSGHLMLGRRRNGTVILGVFLVSVIALLLLAFTSSRATLLTNLLSSRVLILIGIGLLVAAVAWVAVIVRTYVLARPRRLDTGRKALGIAVVTALCLVVAAPFGFAANLANTQRNFLDTLFSGNGGGTSAAEAITKPRLNILLVGSDAGPDRTGARTDSMMVASVDTHTGRTTLFGLPRNLGHVKFPTGSPMATKFPDGFHDNSNPLSGDYLLNAVYAWGRDHPQDAPSGPTQDPGLNLLHQTVAFMLGIQLDYYIEANMAGFASIVDALGGLQVDVGPVPLPIGGITPSGKHVKPDRYIPAGPQLLNGTDALAYARSRTDSTDYTRMGRQRCLLQNLLTQKSPADVLTNFQAVAAATTDSVSTNIPQQVLPSLASLAGQDTVKLESLAFDPSLADPDEPGGRFVTLNVDVPFMREVVKNTIDGTPLPTATPSTAKAKAKPKASDDEGDDSAEPTADPEASNSTAQPPTTAPTSLADSCT